MNYLLQIILFFLFTIFVQPQEKIEEKVSVDWWVLPLFAIDQSGQSITDLKAEDIQLRVNNQTVTEFTLFKMPFLVKEIMRSKMPFSLPPKKKLIFLLFDTAFSTRNNLEKSKAIAKDIVKNASEDTLFSIYSIDPFAGLFYHLGPSNQKMAICDIIDKKIKWDVKAKSIQTIYELLEKKIMYSEKNEGKTGLGGESKYTEKEKTSFLLEELSLSLKNTNQKYFQSFESLYYSLNTIQDNKFVYIFSEGISLFVRKVIRHADNEFNFLLKKTAEHLNRSGAVLFIINPAGALESFFSIESGEDSLRYLARESGGKYLEGEKRSISNRIQKMHHAYYELAFPEKDSFAGNVRNIIVRSNRPKVKIHTLHSIEKRKEYAEMDNIEKEVMVINILKNPNYKSPFTTSALPIENLMKKKGEIYYEIILPDYYIKKNIDIYKIWINELNNEVELKKETVVSPCKIIKLKLKSKPDLNARLVVVNSHAKTILIQGFKETPKQNYDIINDFIKPIEKESLNQTLESPYKEDRKTMSTEKQAELDKILVGVALYCQKLKRSVFHYFCKEKILEIFELIQTYKVEKASFFDRDTGTLLHGIRNQRNNEKWVRKKSTNKCTLDYQIIRDKGKVKEQRKLLKGKMKNFFNKPIESKLSTFFTSNIPLSPIMILSFENQNHYHFYLVKYEKIMKSKIAVIEVIPKSSEYINSIFGKLWIDMKNFSILKMAVNPRSIGGYYKLSNIAKQLQSNLILSCEVDFYLSHNGIRFPTKVEISEKYSGGNLLKDMLRKTTWERSKTVIKMVDYKFFHVDTEEKLYLNQ